MICTAPSPQSINELYMKIRSKRPAWFMAATGLSEDNYAGFENWIHSNVSFWMASKDNIVLVDRQSFVAVIHPLFLGPVDLKFLQGVLDELAHLGIHRVEVPLLSPEGRTIHRVLRMLGFQQEGILRHKERIKTSQPGQYIYLDVQLWVTLLEGAKDGQED